MWLRYSNGWAKDWLHWVHVKFFPLLIPLHWCTSSCSRFVNALKHWLHLHVKSSAGSNLEDVRVCCLYPYPLPRYEVGRLSSLKTPWSLSGLIGSDSVLLKGGRPLCAGAWSVKFLRTADSNDSFFSALARDLSCATRSRGGCTPFRIYKKKLKKHLISWFSKNAHRSAWEMKNFNPNLWQNWHLLLYKILYFIAGKLIKEKERIVSKS